MRYGPTNRNKHELSFAIHAQMSGYVNNLQPNEKRLLEINYRKRFIVPVITL